MFADLKRFIAAHRLCGDLTGEVGEPEAEGYGLRIACVCGAAFERWVTPDAGDRDLLRSRLLAHPN